ncbi:hypothetical protein GCM10011375_06960 [Hymenobacter qilianensis]|uniref:Uncharacterized protein n=2 Tax=Hymenobacter qilianensis TaxID=1385715 RepID=A0ACB5PMW7_9BACT|nr:hypothetical protein [Hymenobacter qilianensis]QNP53660.1 hypothetical protein H9L05_08990 [Hymenobacter qilianensis]GGF54147.1 hypothetical protein GCM10011375_06960 [Hymenobacter qilianensis]
MPLATLLLALPDPTDALPLLNRSRELLAERGMGVLGAWALLNLVVSGYLVARTDKRTEAHYFHQMNVGWNLVNVALAVFGILSAHPNQVAGMTLADSLTAQFNFEKILLFNAGLDVAYIATGSWLRARAASTDRRPERLLGFGRSLWVQGAFLLVFDVCFYFLYHQFAADLLRLL